MRVTPVNVRDFVTQVGEGIGFAVRFRAECGADSGPQVRRYQAFIDERGMQPGDFGDQEGYSGRPVEVQADDC